MKISIGGFATRSVVTDLGASSTASGVRAALLRYAERLRSDPPPLSPPSFLDSRPSRGRGASLEMQIDGKMLDLLENEARNHAVSVERVALHALFLELAEGDEATATASVSLSD